MRPAFSAAADRNKEPILNVLLDVVAAEDKSILEIGSGTGQHGAFFSRKIPNAKWYFSDREENHDAIRAWISQSESGNFEGPVKYEVGKDEFPKGRFDIVFTANTFHIMSWKLVKTLIKSLGKSLQPGGRFVVYGPFKYRDKPTSKSNMAFDLMLKERDPASGIRFFEDVKAQLETRGFRLIKDYQMPANNRALVFLKI